MLHELRPNNNNQHNTHNKSIKFIASPPPFMFCLPFRPTWNPSSFRKTSRTKVILGARHWFAQ